MPSLASIANLLRDNVASLFYEEAEVARYTVVTESGSHFTVPDPATGTNDRHIQEIAAPGVFPESRPVLLFRTTHTGHPAMSARLNAASLLHQTLADTAPHSWHLIAPGGSLRADHNELTFGVSGDGSVVFSDVLILYTSNRLTVSKPRVVVATQ